MHASTLQNPIQFGTFVQIKTPPHMFHAASLDNVSVTNLVEFTDLPSGRYLIETTIR
jgi:hypothetical protein